MSGFSPDWLALREPADAAARSEAGCDPIRRRDGAPLDVVDLGAGTGANLRYLAPRLGGPQRWRLVDADPAVLAAAVPALHAWAEAGGVGFAETAGGIRLDGTGFACEVVLDKADIRTLAGCLPEPGGLLTASALLDLVSLEWLRTLAERSADAGVSVLFALTYDGRMHCEPAEPGDARVRALVNRHQRGDKGFGPALGPRAPAAAIETFAARRYVLRSESTDWRLGPQSAALQRELLAGWHAAAVESAPDERDALDAWLARRLEHVAEGRSRLVVGHTDIAGWRPVSTGGV